MRELDDILEHAGVKGMKWGVVKTRAVNGIKTHIKKSNAKSRVKDEKFHEKKKNNKAYKKVYNSNLKKSKGNHKTAIAKTRKQYNQKKRILAMTVTAKTLPAAVTTGKIIVAASKAYAKSPQGIRKGKNIVNAMKGNPLRYVDGAAMRNVVN